MRPLAMFFFAVCCLPLQAATPAPLEVRNVQTSLQKTNKKDLLEMVIQFDGTFRGQPGVELRLASEHVWVVQVEQAGGKGWSKLGIYYAPTLRKTDYQDCRVVREGETFDFKGLKSEVLMWSNDKRFKSGMTLRVLVESTCLEGGKKVTQRLLTVPIELKGSAATP